MAIDTANRANVTAIIGGTGSGKSSRMKWILNKKKYQRLAIFDPEGEYENYGVVVRSLGALLGEIRKPKFRVVFVPHESQKAQAAQFNAFCHLVAGDDMGVGGNMAVVVDELAQNTKPNWAPDGWKKVCNKGRKRGLVVYGMSQFPAQVDKSFWGACTTIYTGRLITPAHSKTMAEQLGVPSDEIRALPDLAYIELDVRNVSLARGQGRYSGGKPIF